MLVKTAHNFTAQKYRRLKVKNDGINNHEFGIGTQLGGGLRLTRDLMTTCNLLSKNFKEVRRGSKGFCFNN